MKITGNLSQLFTQFIRYGIENSDILTSKSFIDCLYTLLTDEYKYEDFTEIVVGAGAGDGAFRRTVVQSFLTQWETTRGK